MYDLQHQYCVVVCCFVLFSMQCFSWYMITSVSHELLLPWPSYLSWGTVAQAGNSTLAEVSARQDLFLLLVLVLCGVKGRCWTVSALYFFSNHSYIIYWLLIYQYTATTHLIQPLPCLTDEWMNALSGCLYYVPFFLTTTGSDSANSPV